MNSDHFVNDFVMRAYVESCIGGRAAKTLLFYLNDQNHNYIQTTNDLLNYLFQKYHDFNKQKKAIEKFQKLFMKTINDYTLFKHKFVRLCCGASKRVARLRNVVGELWYEKPSKNHLEQGK